MKEYHSVDRVLICKKGKNVFFFSQQSCKDVILEQALLLFTDQLSDSWSTVTSGGMNQVTELSPVITSASPCLSLSLSLSLWVYLPQRTSFGRWLSIKLNNYRSSCCSLVHLKNCLVAKLQTFVLLLTRGYRVLSDRDNVKLLDWHNWQNFLSWWKFKKSTAIKLKCEYKVTHRSMKSWTNVKFMCRLNLLDYRDMAGGRQTPWH